MQTILLSMVSGLLINVITYLSGKLNLSKTYVSVGLSVILGIILYAGSLLVNKYPVQRETITEFVLGAYGVSQAVYSLFVKLTENK